MAPSFTVHDLANMLQSAMLRIDAQEKASKDLEGRIDMLECENKKLKAQLAETVKRPGSGSGARVAHTTELLEKILLSVDQRTLYHSCRQVNCSFRETIHGSTPLRAILFLNPTLPAGSTNTSRINDIPGTLHGPKATRKGYLQVGNTRLRVFNKEGHCVHIEIDMRQTPAAVSQRSIDFHIGHPILEQYPSCPAAMTQLTVIFNVKILDRPESREWAIRKVEANIILKPATLGQMYRVAQTMLNRLPAKDLSRHLRVVSGVDIRRHLKSEDMHLAGLMTGGASYHVCNKSMETTSARRL